MARTSFSRRRNASKSLNAFPGIAALTALLVLGAVTLGVSGCGNDNPADNGGSMTVDIRGIKDQLSAGSFSTSTAGPGESAATTDVKSLVIGAVVITFTDTPLTSDTNIDSGVENDLADDVINSINYFSIVDLPTSDDFVEFKVPPPAAGHWQVAAIGTRKTIATFEDLDSDSVGIYYGFTPQFYNTSGGGDGPTVDIEMKRACFIDDPPKGCAAYDDDGKIIITSTVTILDILLDGTSLGASVGGYTFGTAITTQPQADSVETQINGAFSPSSGEVTVVATHPDAPGQAACSTVTHANYASRPECTGTSVTKY